MRARPFREPTRSSQAFPTIVLSILAALLCACATPETTQHGKVDAVQPGEAALAASNASSPAVDPSRCGPDYDWNQAVAPQKIYGNTWYVGTCGISAILIASDGGHILIDAGTEKSAELVAANIRSLGFKLEDVREILMSHEHFDHVGGIAALQHLTGAAVLAREPAATTLERGANDRSDPQFLAIKGFPPVANVRRIRDGETVKLGVLALTAHATPGHTPGGTSWTWTSCENRRCLNIAYVDSLTAISDDVYRYTEEARHPGVVANFRKTLATVAGLPCDILISTHPQRSDLWDRLGPKAAKPLIDPKGCREYAEDAGKALDERIEKEKNLPPSTN